MAHMWVDCSFRGDDPSAFRRPAILLELEGHLSKRRNETTAEASIHGGTMAVSFWMAEPPELSFFSVHCTNKSPDFKVFPHVVGAEGPFVLLHALFYGSLEDDYFMYKASDSPSLELIPPPDSEVSEFGIVPCSLGCHYRLAALYNAPSDYQLEIYCSETKTWSSRTLLNPCPGVKIVPEKVVSLGVGSLGWVDLSRGLLACDLRQATPCLRFTPLPMPLRQNRGRLKTASESGVSARWFRDLTCVNGMLKFIEIEHRFVEDEKPIDPSDNEFLLDSDLIKSLRHQDMDVKDKKKDGWRAMVWTRAVCSDCWCKWNIVDVSEIMVGKYFVPKTYISTFPTLSLDGDNLLYFKFVEEHSDQNGWVLALDLRKKTVEAMGVFSFEYIHSSMQAFRLCTLSDHLIMSPGIERSAFVTVTEGESSANGPDDKPVCMDIPVSLESRGKSQPLRTLARANSAGNDSQYDDLSWDEAPSGDSNVESTRKLRRANHAGNDSQDDDLSWDEAPSGDSNVESTRKLRRLLMGKLKPALNENRFVQNDLVPWVHPFNSNLQCFKKLKCDLMSDGS